MSSLKKLVLKKKTMDLGLHLRRSPHSACRKKEKSKEVTGKWLKRPETKRIGGTKATGWRASKICVIRCWWQMKRELGRKETCIFPLRTTEQVTEFAVEDQASQSWLLTGTNHRGNFKSVQPDHHRLCLTWSGYGPTQDFLKAPKDKAS